MKDNDEKSTAGLPALFVNALSTWIKLLSYLLF